MRVVAAVGFLLAALAAAGPARAGDERGAIAVLPFTSSERHLEIYGMPVSRALVVELHGAAGAPVQIVSDPASLPRRIAWVIDGRILERGGGKVVLEARLRDPDQGRAAGLVATHSLPLRQIDQLARDLARQLLPLLAEARAARDKEAARRVAIRAPGRPAVARHPQPRPAPSTSTAPPAAVAPPRAGDPGAPSPGTAEPRAPSRTEEPRVLLVGRAAGGSGAAGVAADPIVTASAADLAQRLGRRPVVVELGGIAPPRAVQAALAGAGASHALLSQVQSLEFAWRGVLTARGRVRLVLVDAAGDALYDSIVETDTLVGSRGDRHEALLALVARQAMEIAAPRLRRLLAP